MSHPCTTNELTTLTQDIKGATEAHLEESGGLLRLSPTWVPRSFLQPGLRIKLHPDDTYAYGLSRGGIDERWFGSTTEAANEGRVPDEGLSYVVVGRERFTLRDAVEACGATIVGSAIWGKYGRWPVYSKYFDNMGPIPLSFMLPVRSAPTSRSGAPTCSGCTRTSWKAARCRGRSL